MEINWEREAFGLDVNVHVSLVVDTGVDPAAGNCFNTYGNAEGSSSGVAVFADVVIPNTGNYSWIITNFGHDSSTRYRLEITEISPTGCPVYSTTPEFTLQPSTVGWSWPLATGVTLEPGQVYTISVGNLFNGRRLGVVLDLFASIDNFNTETGDTHSWKVRMQGNHTESIESWAAAQSPQWNLTAHPRELKQIPNWLGYADELEGWHDLTNQTAVATELNQTWQIPTDLTAYFRQSGNYYTKTRNDGTPILLSDPDVVLQIQIRMVIHNSPEMGNNTCHCGLPSDHENGCPEDCTYNFNDGWFDTVLDGRFDSSVESRRFWSPPIRISDTRSPTVSPTTSPTSQPSGAPSAPPSSSVPTEVPSIAPSWQPSSSIPSGAPTSSPTRSSPTRQPSQLPSESPSAEPTSANPTSLPTSSTTLAPSQLPTVFPSSSQPTTIPSAWPSQTPSTKPSQVPTSQSPTQSPSLSSTSPTISPTVDLVTGDQADASTSESDPPFEDWWIIIVVILALLFLCLLLLTLRAVRAAKSKSSDPVYGEAGDVKGWERDNPAYDSSENFTIIRSRDGAIGNNTYQGTDRAALGNETYASVDGKTRGGILANDSYVAANPIPRYGSARHIQQENVYGDVLPAGANGDNFDARAALANPVYTGIEPPPEETYATLELTQAAIEDGDDGYIQSVESVDANEAKDPTLVRRSTDWSMMPPNQNSTQASSSADRNDGAVKNDTYASGQESSVFTSPKIGLERDGSMVRMQSVRRDNPMLDASQSPDGGNPKPSIAARRSSANVGNPPLQLSFELPPDSSSSQLPLVSSPAGSRDFEEPLQSPPSHTGSPKQTAVL